MNGKLVNKGCEDREETRGLDTFERKTAYLILDGPCTDSALAATEAAVRWARGREERINSVHLLYGLVSNADSISSAILNQTGYHLLRLKKTLFGLSPGIFEGPFPETTAFVDVSSEFEEVMSRTFDLSGDSSELDSAHLLLGILETPSRAREILCKPSLGEKLKENLKQFLSARRKLEEL
ncbi:MAG TPA: hypothetical protein EYO33_16690 [Phycisphaerales bacterium]|nr:hypothetical protein [Phycisphaerales bacterium]